VCDALMKGEPIPAGANEEMIRHGHAYRDFCASLHKDNVVIPTFVELAVPLFYRPQDVGHVDYLLFQHTLNRVDVVDYKYGAGVKVHADHNKQMSVYGRSAIEEYDLEGWVRDDTLIRLHIFQPRCRDLMDDFDDLTVEESDESAAPKGIESTWEITWDKFKLFTEKEIGVPAQLIQDNATHLLTFAASESTCKWCPASAFCDTRVEALASNAPIVRKMLLPDKIEPTPPDQITDDKLAQILRHAPDLKKWLATCEEYAFNRALAGNPLPQTKLIEGRGTRKWTDEAAVAIVLQSLDLDPFTPPTLISPSAAEKMLKEAGISKKDFHSEALEKLTQRVPGSPKLTSIADPRPEYRNAIAEAEFEVLPPA